MKPRPKPLDLIHWGAGIGTQFTGSTPPFSMQAQTDFEQRCAGGKPASLVVWGATFHSTAYYGGPFTFPKGEFDVIRSSGRIPLLTWMSSDTDFPSTSQPASLTPRAIASGSQDAYITSWAKAAAAWGHPFFLRFDHEMNGNWYTWGIGNPYNDNTGPDYVAMWQHVYNIFVANGATNAMWVWCPNIGYPPLSAVFPGSAYVDWVGLDVYNGGPWTSFHDLVSPTYQTLVGLTTKPIMVCEVGCTEANGSKAQWITNMFAAIRPTFPQIHGLSWYDVSSFGPGGRSDWPIESSATSIQAFTTGIAGAQYARNTFANL